MNPLKLHRYLRLTPFDTSTELGRGDERYRLATLSMAASVLSRAAALAVMALSVSLTVPYLGAERFGVWMTLASLAGMLMFLDLGIGNALTNAVAQSVARTPAEPSSKTISGGLGFLVLIGAAVGAALMVLFGVLPWHRLIKVDNPSLYAEIHNAAILFGGLFGLHIVAQGIQRIFAGLQRAFEAHLASTLGSIATLLALGLAAQQEAGIGVLLAITLGIQSVASLSLIFLLYRRGQFAFAGLARHVSDVSPNLLRAGGLFFLLQIGTMVGWGADSLIISSNVGAAQVAVFAVLLRLFQFASQPMSLMNAPLWGAYADAHARHDSRFIRKTLASSLATTLVFTSVVAALLVVMGEALVNRWTGNTIQVTTGLLIAYACWTVLEATGNALAMFMNGCGIIKPQVATVIVFSLLVIVIKILLIRTLGLQAMIVGTALVYATITLAAYGWIFRKALAAPMKQANPHA
jgi:O-antigen/teichoic acid export membrane protein